jgi:hypothetical protein
MAVERANFRFKMPDGGYVYSRLGKTTYEAIGKHLGCDKVPESANVDSKRYGAGTRSLMLVKINFGSRGIGGVGNQAQSDSVKSSIVYCSPDKLATALKDLVNKRVGARQIVSVSVPRPRRLA